VVQLDFGAGAFDGNARHLQVAPQCGADPGFTVLSPRQALNPTPYSLYSLSAGALQGNPVSAGAPTSGQALVWDGSQWASQSLPATPQNYANLKVVAKSGGDFTSVQGALNAITDAGADKRYLVWVAPGTYTETVAMKPYVDIQGAGAAVTKITGGGSASLSAATLTASNIPTNTAELRDLWVDNTGGATFAVAILVTDSYLTLANVRASASGATTTATGVYLKGGAPVVRDGDASATGGNFSYGVHLDASNALLVTTSATASGAANVSAGVFSANSPSSPTLVAVIARGSGPNTNSGIQVVGGSPLVRNSIATGSGGSRAGGMEFDFGTVSVENSELSGSGATSNYGVYNSTPITGTHTAYIDRSRLSGSTATIRNDAKFTVCGGAVITNSGTFTCTGTYNAGYIPLGTNCR
jgi:hypothetical protein